MLQRWMPGASEEILGRWFAKKPEVRSKVILATKVMGYSPGSDSAGNRKITLGTGGSVIVPPFLLESPGTKPHFTFHHTSYRCLSKLSVSSLISILRPHLSVPARVWPELVDSPSGVLAASPPLCVRVCA